MFPNFSSKLLAIIQWCFESDNKWDESEDKFEWKWNWMKSNRNETGWN